MKDEGERREIKRKILTAYRILRGENLLDFMGHISARVSEETFLVTPRMPKFGALQEQNILGINPAGEVTEGNGSAPIELPLHQIVYKHTPDVGSVVHVHPKHAVALSASGRPFEIVHQLCLPFIEGIPVFEDFGMIDSTEKATQMLNKLTGFRAILLRHHGVVVTGSSVEQACVLTIWLEKCAEIQLIAGELKVQEIRKSHESLKLLEHQLRTTVKAAWNYYESKHSA